MVERQEGIQELSDYGSKPSEDVLPPVSTGAPGWTNAKSLFILSPELCERICYYTLQGSQMFFLEKSGFMSAQASTINSAFGMIVYFMCLIGGWVADAFLGRFRSIICSLVIYVLGVSLISVAALPSISSSGLFLTMSMVAIPIGTGLMKPNLCNFGADQFDKTKPGAAENEESYFKYFYLFINAGATVAFGYFTTLATSGQGTAIPKEWGFFAAYLASAGFMILASFIFFLGIPHYLRDPMPAKSTADGPLTLIKKSILAAKNGAHKTKANLSILGWASLILFFILAIAGAFISNSTVARCISYVSFALIIIAGIALCVAHKNNDWLDNADVAGTMSVVPVILVAELAFGIGLSSQNNMALQACQMNLFLGSWEVNGTFVNIIECIAIVIFVPLLDRFVIPALKKVGIRVTLEMQICAGIGFVILSQIVSVIIEFLRRKATVLDLHSNCAPVGSDGLTMRMSDMSVAYMFLPMLLVGIGDAIMSPAMLHYAYNAAPTKMRSITQAFNLVCVGCVSNGVTAVLTTMFNKFITPDLNKGNLEYYYYGNIGITLVGLIAYWLVKPKAGYRLSQHCDRDARATVVDREEFELSDSA